MKNMDLPEFDIDFEKEEKQIKQKQAKQQKISQNRPEETSECESCKL